MNDSTDVEPHIDCTHLELTQDEVIVSDRLVVRVGWK